jgi:SAM-dependent MidA family methyltransferase
MTLAGKILREEIARSGPMSFNRFMDVALYHAEHGYYRRARDPFGKEGDFYTAEQLQPVFGILIASVIRSLCLEMGSPRNFTVVELGAGRGEMAAALSEFRYLPVDIDRGEMPGRFCGVVFANEFFDALPVDVVVKRKGGLREMRVAWRAERFEWVENGTPDDDVLRYAEQYAAPLEDGSLLEVNLSALRWIESIARCLEQGFLLVIDYGYTAAEVIRFPRGTLMSYRRHAASENVLHDPGSQDITAHVCFTALERHAALHNFETVRFESLAQTLLRAGEADQFRAALDAESEMARLQRRLQLKSLLFGMGETFRTLLLKKKTEGGPQNKNGPEILGAFE